MSIAGLVFLALSWGGIIGLNLFCFYRLTRSKTAPLDNRAD